MYEFIYTTENGITDTVKFFAESETVALAKAKDWRPRATFQFVGFWSVHN